MENVNWLKLKLNQKMINLQAQKAAMNANFNLKPSSGESLMQQTHNNIINNMQRQFTNPEQMRMNSMASADRAVYVKNLLNLPKNMVELLVLIQNDGKIPQQPKPVHNEQVQNPKENQQNQNNGNQQQNLNKSDNNQIPHKPNVKPNGKDFQKHLVNNDHNINRHINRHHRAEQNQVRNNEIIQNQKQIVHENLKNNIQNRLENNINSQNQAIHNAASKFHNARNVNNLHHHNHRIMNQPIPNKVQQDVELAEQLQNTNEQNVSKMTPEELAAFKQQLASQLNQNVNLTHVSAFLQKNSKLAMNKMVTMMSMATSQGMTDIKPLQDTVNIINASVSANSSSSATQTLKNLMLLYLPWLPLQEGVGFDLEIEQDEEIPESETFIKIMITMVNFGNLNATVSLMSTNSVDISITCSNSFPKKELFKRLFKAGSQHSMQTVIDFKNQKLQLEQDTINPKAKVNLSNVNQVNPYLLLMAHSIIRHTIEIDNIQSSGGQIISD